MWYVVPHGAALSIELDKPLSSYTEAVKKAKALQESFGSHCRVLKIAIRHNTQEEA